MHSPLSALTKPARIVCATGEGARAACNEADDTTARDAHVRCALLIIIVIRLHFCPLYNLTLPSTSASLPSHPTPPSPSPSRYLSKLMGKFKGPSSFVTKSNAKGYTYVPDQLSIEQKIESVHVEANEVKADMRKMRGLLEGSSVLEGHSIGVMQSPGQSARQSPRLPAIPHASSGSSSGAGGNEWAQAMQLQGKRLDQLESSLAEVKEMCRAILAVQHPERG